MSLRATLLQALEDRYNAQISEADATIQIYLEKPVAIGEHPQHIDEIDKLITKIAEAEEKITVLQQFKLWLKVMVRNTRY